MKKQKLMVYKINAETVFMLEGDGNVAKFEIRWRKETNLVSNDASETSYGRRTCTLRGKTRFNGGHCCKPE